MGAILAPGAAVNTGFKEGEETQEFWDSLGGKTEYSSIKNMGIAPGFEPRLFHCSNSQGYFHMKEIYNFNQEDLNNNDIMVLDVFSTVYIWVGRKSNDKERKNALKKVESYVQTCTDGRDIANVQYVTIDPCSEPINFTTHFPEWEDEVAERWLELDPYAAAMAKIEAEKKAAADAKWGKKEEVKYESSESGVTHAYEVLKKGCPEGVDPTKKESYLSDAEFQSVFGMDKAAFYALKDWKRKDIKKAKGLF